MGLSFSSSFEVGASNWIGEDPSDKNGAAALAALSCSLPSPASPLGGFRFSAFRPPSSVYLQLPIAHASKVSTHCLHLFGRPLIACLQLRSMYSVRSTLRDLRERREESEGGRFVPLNSPAQLKPALNHHHHHHQWVDLASS